MKEKYPDIRVGDRVTFGHIEDILKNVGVDLSNDPTEDRLKILLGTNVPAGFNSTMSFMFGKSGIVKSIEVYPNPITSRYLTEKYLKESIKIVDVVFDDPKINRRAREYTLSSPMFMPPRGIFKQPHDEIFINKLGKSSSWGESQITEKGNADAI